MAYLKIPVTGIAILGAIVAVVMVNVTALNSPRITTEQESAMTTKMISEETLQPQAGRNPDYAARFTPGVLALFQMEFSWNYERQMNLAFVYALIGAEEALSAQRSWPQR